MKTHKRKVDIMNANARQDTESGSVLVVALLMLVLLTLLGIYAATTTEIELQIAGNEEIYQRNLYAAESAAMECARMMDDEVAMPNIDPSLYTWLHAIGSVTLDDARDNDFWAGDSVALPAPRFFTAEVDATGNTTFMVVDQGVAGTSSLDMTKSNVHEYQVYGRWYNPAKPSQGRGLIAVGFRRAW